MKVAIAGSSGFVGSELVRVLRARGDEVWPLVRREPRGNELRWDPAAGTLDPATLGGFDALVSLGGENIAGGRWTPARKQVLRDSRVGPTELLSRTLSSMDRPPGVWVSISGEAFYGNPGDVLVDETHPVGPGFLPELCRDWEAATGSPPGVRVVHARLGVVIGPGGGAIAELKLPFQLGLGGPVGGGRQWMPWIGLHDAARAFAACIDDPGIRGPVNLVHPEPVRQAEFARALATALSRPAFVPTPAFVMKLLFGEMAEEMLLGGKRLAPGVLSARGFQWQQSLAQAVTAAVA